MRWLSFVLGFPDLPVIIWWTLSRWAISSDLASVIEDSLRIWNVVQLPVYAVLPPEGSRTMLPLPVYAVLPPEGSRTMLPSSSLDGACRGGDVLYPPCG